MISDFDRAGELAVRLIVSADLAAVTEGLSGLASIGYGDTDDSLIDNRSQQEFDITLDYRPPRIEGLWFRVRGAWRERGSDLTEDFRVIVNYELSF